MDAIVNGFYNNPMAWIALVFALIASFGFVMFVSGFFAGLPNLFTQSANAEHVEHHRVRATWGILILIHTFIAWEIVRLIGSWFGGPYVDPGLVGGLLVAYIILLVIMYVFVGISHAIRSDRH